MRPTRQPPLNSPFRATIQYYGPLWARRYFLRGAKLDSLREIYDRRYRPPLSKRAGPPPTPLQRPSSFYDDLAIGSFRPSKLVARRTAPVHIDAR